MKIGKLVTLLSATAFILFGCGDVNSGKGDSANSKVEGIELSYDLLTNNQITDESIIKVEVNNTTEETYSGKISLYNSARQRWVIEVENLPAGQVLERELKNEYIKNPQDGIMYEIEGHLSDKSFETDVKYTVIPKEGRGAFIVQVENVTKENVIDITKDLYYKHGSSLVNIDFYDKSVDINNINFEKDYPEAQYFGTAVDKKISIDNETIEFEP